METRTGENDISYIEAFRIIMFRATLLNDARAASVENLFCKKKEVSDFLVIGYLYLEINCNFIYVTSFCSIQLKLSSVIGIG